jgi:hypothetical protein
MTTIWGDPDAGFAVDWDWGRGLTVWTLTGRHFEARYGDKVLEHELPSRPAGEREARNAARRWWREQGRAEALAAGTGSTAGP